MEMTKFRERYTSSQGHLYSSTQCWKILKNVAFKRFLILVFSTNFCPIKIDLSGNTIWLQTSGFQKMRLLMWFSNTVLTLQSSYPVSFCMLLVTFFLAKLFFRLLSNKNGSKNNFWIDLLHNTIFISMHIVSK